VKSQRCWRRMRPPTGCSTAPRRRSWPCSPPRGGVRTRIGAVPPEQAAGRGPGSDPAETTALLAAARAGDREAYDRVFTSVYDELRRVASRQAARVGAGESISTTVVVHEAYLKLVGAPGRSIAAGNDRIHFFALAARAMRQILVDHARHRG